MCDRNLTHAIATLMGNQWDKSVLLTIQIKVLQYIAFVSLEPTIEVMNSNASDRCDNRATPTRDRPRDRSHSATETCRRGLPAYQRRSLQCVYQCCAEIQHGV